MSLSYCTPHPLYYICFLLFLSFPSNQTLPLPCYGPPRWSQGPGHPLDHSLTHWVAKPLQRHLGGPSLWVPDRQGITTGHVGPHVYTRVRTRCARLSHSVVYDCDPMDCSPPGSSVHGISQTRILEWVAISYSGIFPNQGSNHCLPQLLHWQADSLHWATWEAHGIN